MKWKYFSSSFDVINKNQLTFDMQMKGLKETAVTRIYGNDDDDDDESSKF